MRVICMCAACCRRCQTSPPCPFNKQTHTTPSPTCTACTLPWRSLSYVSKCLAKARTDIEDLRRRKAHLEAATQWRPCLRR